MKDNAIHSNATMTYFHPQKKREGWRNIKKYSMIDDRHIALPPTKWSYL